MLLSEQTWSHAPESSVKMCSSRVSASLVVQMTSFGVYSMILVWLSPWHSLHPADEHVTVITGELYMGLGETVDTEAAHALTSGSFALMKAGTKHYAYTEGETIIQLHGIGPWGITYLNPADDPRTEM